MGAVTLFPCRSVDYAIRQGKYRFFRRGPLARDFGEFMRPTKQSSQDAALLAHAVDMILNRIRLLAREMCPADRQKLEEVIDRAFADLSQVAAVESRVESDELH